MAKIVWHSAPVWNQTGYGQQSLYFIKLLQYFGNEVKLASVSQLTYTPIITYDNIEHYPSGKIVWGPQGVVDLCNKWKPDAVITLFDIWPFDEDFGAKLRDAGARWLPYCPIDHDPMPNAVASRLAWATMPLAMSKFALREMEKNSGIPGPWYMPHGYDGRIYKPGSRTTSIADEDTFVVGVVAANNGQWDRKGFEQMMLAYKVLTSHYDNTVLYIHTDPSPEPQNIDLIQMAKMIGVDFKYPDPIQLSWGFSSHQMADIYRGMDVFMLLSRGEGFGVPLIEAQACGVPVITTNFTAQADLGRAGWLIPCDKVMSPKSSWQGIARVDDAADALLDAYRHWERGKLAEAKERAIASVAEYDFENIAIKYVEPLGRFLDWSRDNDSDVKTIDNEG